MTNPVQENIQLASSKIATAQAQVENAAAAAEAMAMNKLNNAVNNAAMSIVNAIPKPKIPEIPALPAIPSMPQLPALPSIPTPPNLNFSIPSTASLMATIMKKLAGMVPLFSYAIAVPKFKLPRPDWKGPPKIEPPKLPV